jgi:hypothetical protein
LRNVAKEHGIAVTAAGESRFQLQSKRNIDCHTRGSFAEPGFWRSTFSTLQCCVWRAFAADARVDLHPSNLIQGR